MIFAQFYQRSAISKDLIEATGDRSVIVLDGRFGRGWQNKISALECLKRGYLAYMLCRGESFSRSSSIGPMTLVFGPDMEGEAERIANGLPYRIVHNPQQEQA